MSITLSCTAASPDFGRVEFKPASAESGPAPQNQPVDPALSSKTTLTNHSQLTEFKASTYTKSVSDTSSSTRNLSAINSNPDLEETADSTVETLAETSDIDADNPVTENSIELTESQNSELADSDDLLNDSDPDQQNPPGRHLDLLEARYRSSFMVVDHLLSQLIVTRHLLAAHFIALPLPE